MAEVPPDVERLVTNYEALWRGDVSKLDVISESFAFYSPLGAVHGREAFEDFLHEQTRAFPDGAWKPDDALVSDGVVMMEFTWTGTHEGEYEGVPPTGREHEFSGMAKLVIEDGNIREDRTYFDPRDLLEQLDVERREHPREQGATDAVRAYIDAYNAGDVERIERLLSEEFVVHGLPGIDGSEHGREAFLEWMDATFSAFPDKHTEVEELIADGDLVAARWRSTATHEGPFGDVPATNREWTAEAQAFVRVEGGTLAELWFQPDQLGMLRQLGVIEPTGD